MRLVHAINLLLLAALFLGSAAVWPLLPEAVPGHLDLRGEPTRYTETSLRAWFAMPVFGALLAAFNYGLAQALPRRPAWVNLPDKAAFRALPPARQARVIRHVQTMMHWVTASTLLIFILVQVALYRAATAGSDRGAMVMILLTAVVSTPVLLAFHLPRVQSELRRQQDAHAAEQSG